MRVSDVKSNQSSSSVLSEFELLPSEMYKYIITITSHLILRIDRDNLMKFPHLSKEFFSFPPSFLHHS